MTYTFVNISPTQFTINGRELYKTFIPVLLNATHIRLQSAYDSQTVLVSKTHVSNFIVDGVAYANSTALNTAIYTVLFSKEATAAISNGQIELNRLAIISLQNSKSNIGHTHDSRYYKKSEIDIFITNIVSQSDLLAKGEVDGDLIKFRKADNTIVFSINAESFTSQGTSVDFNSGVLTLKNEKGEVLSTTEVKAIETYYDEFKFNSGVTDDLSDLTLTEPFELIRTTGDLYFFVSNTSNVENFSGSRIYINEIELFANLSEPTITTNSFFAWQLTIPSEYFIDGNSYTYNIWDRKIETDERKKIIIEGNRFEHVPIVGNDGSSFKAGDLAINGWINQTTYGKILSYVSGDATEVGSWEIIEQI